MTWDMSNLKECTRFGDLWKVERIYPHRNAWGLRRCQNNKGRLWVSGEVKLHTIWTVFPVKVEVGDFIFRDHDTHSTSLLKKGEIDKLKQLTKERERETGAESANI